MATAMAFLGMSPFGANEVPATDPRKDDVARACGRAILRLV
jgi:dihydroxy-acid dehydratase